MKRVLIWDNFELRNVGGPSGYLYNIHEYLKDNPTPQITFLSDLLKNDRSSKDNSLEKKQEDFVLDHTNRNVITGTSNLFRAVYYYVREKKRTVFYWIHYQIEYIQKLCWKQFYQDASVAIDSSLVNEFDIIHFHFLTQLSNFKKQYPLYSGKIVLTSHCPCPWVDEILEKERTWYRTFKPLILYNECKTYNNADYLLFPCVEAREPYEKNFFVKETFRHMKDRFLYVPSALLDFSVDSANIQKYSDFGIPEDAFVITFFGRHNYIKGYDLLKDVGIKLLEKYENLYFLCAGVGPIDAPIHKRWIELGFISNVQELLSQSNLYILPNKETYFDLVLLEILRAGVPAIISNTGGNNYFKKFPQEELIGLQFFDLKDIDGLSKIVGSFIEKFSEDIVAYNQQKYSNRLLFEKYFRIPTYISNYLRVMNAIDEGYSH